MKIAICIPVHRQTEGVFTQCLASMIHFTDRATIIMDGEHIEPEIEIFMVSSSLIPESRNRLVAEALNWGADYQLWMDADHIFPSDALVRLLSRNVPVVGCNYSRRANPTSPTASGKPEDGKQELVWTTKEKAEADEVEEVGHLGLGLCLMKMGVYGALDEKAMRDGKDSFWPLFYLEPKAGGVRFKGEDAHFFSLIRDAGIPVFLDHALSWQVGHVSEHILTNAHAVTQKVAWEAKSKTELDHMREEVDG